MSDNDHRKGPLKSTVEKVIDSMLSAGGGLVTLLSSLLAAALIIYSGYVLYDTFNTQQQASSSAWDLLQYKPEIIEDEETPLFSEELEKINPQYRAWLTVYDTTIDYPVVQGNDDLYYASHDIYGRTSLTGAIYLAAANSPNFSDSYNLIYGHHMDSNVMFGGLDDFIKTRAYFDSHRTGVVVTKTGVFDIEFFAAITTDAYENRIYTVGNRLEDVLAFLRSGGAGGVGVGTDVKFFDEEAAADATKLIALSTCANASTNGRLVVIGKLTEHVVLNKLTVQKVWDDADNQDGIRPAELKVDLIKNGAETAGTVTLNAENEWTASLEVPKFENYSPIRYTWREDKTNLAGYTETQEADEETGLTTTITNTHEPAVVTRTVSKTWDDENDRDGIRPASVTVRLYGNDELVATRTLDDSNGWRAAVENLPVNANGQPIAYAWREDDVPGYTFTEVPVVGDANASIALNRHEPEKIDLTVKKVWDDADNQDGKRPPELTVSLMKGGAVFTTKTLSEANAWTAAETGLYRYENKGQEIVYTWQENENADYTLTGSETDSEQPTLTTLTNTHTPETVDLTVWKVWDDADNQDNMRPRILSLTLSNGDTYTLRAEDNWMLEVKGLPKYAGGEEIAYTWTESVPDGYEQTGNVTTGTSTVLTNRHETGTTVATVVKVWDDADNQDGKRPDKLTVKLLADGAETGKSVTLPTEYGWTATLTGLDENANGSRITYTWEEDEAAAKAGYRLSKTETDGTTTTLTNTHTPETVDLSVKKVWNDADDQDGKRPRSVNAVLSNGMTRPLTLSEANGWTATVTGLPKYAGGREIVYTWTEEAPQAEGYALTGNEADSEQPTLTILTNSYTPETVDLSVEKIWIDADNQDGKRPASVTVTLTANGEPVEGAKDIQLTGANEWKFTAVKQPVYAKGERILYAWTEKSVDGYTADIPAVNIPATGAAATGISITNTHEPEKITLTVHKAWDDAHNQDGIRPQRVKVTLTANGEPVEGVKDIELSEENSWSFTTPKLPAFAKGERILYAWTEADEGLEAYTKTIPAFSTAETTEITITNTHSAGKVSRTVKKVWDDDDNRDGKRPEELTVKLLANGEDTGRSVTLNEDNGWTATLDGLDQFAAGEEIDYTWQEDSEAVSGYTLTGTSVDGETTTLTNTHEPIRTYKAVKKQWNDRDNADGARPQTLDFTLTANGEPVATVTVSEANEWTAAVENLYEYEQGVPIDYKWVEPDVPNYERTGISSFEHYTWLTNTQVSTYAAVRKVWDDDDNRDGIRPESLQVGLYADNAFVRSVTLSEENNWSAQITNLPLADGERLIAYTWREAAQAGYRQTSSVTDGHLTTLTNTHTPETVALTVRKIWEDNNSAKRPVLLNVYLIGSDGSSYTATLTSTNNWQATVKVPVHAAGKGLVYRWVEPDIPNYRQSSVTTTGTVTTFVNTRIPGSTPPGPPNPPTPRPIPPASPDDTVVIDDFGTPLGLGEIYIHIGDCLE